MPNPAQTETLVLHVAVPVPLHQYFDYLPPPDFPLAKLQAGLRVRVPWRKQEIIGVLIGSSYQSQLPTQQLKQAIAILDELPILSTSVLELAQFASNYYQYPIGEVVEAGLPHYLRLGRPANGQLHSYYQLTSIGSCLEPHQFKRSPRQKKLLELMQQCPEGLSDKQLRSFKIPNAMIKLFEEKKWLARCLAPKKFDQTSITLSTALQLGMEQQFAVNSVVKALGHFQAFLLDGVTGSGKTEVYLQIIAQVLANNKQALVLVPEIGLTPQTVERFKQRFNLPIALLHSGLSHRERLNAWLLAQQGEAAIIIGTRSAIFTPIPRLGVIIVDEEHDLSFKQQEGFRYSARDLAIVRARLDHVPVILGSATPSLESIYNVQQHRYQLLHLPERAGSAIHPELKLIDLRKQPIQQGISTALLQAISKHLANNGQVLLFLNRRGYAPTLICQACGHVATCRQCDARMTLHLSPRLLQCHHCGITRSVDKKCQKCSETRLVPLGLGTERIEELLQKHFPTVRIVRIDRDTTRQRGSLDNMLESIHNGDARILIGTQMLAKGHHFPAVTLVAIIDADSGLYSVDFRGSERAAQIITQVAGRAGRADRPGEVLIQTLHPEHPLLQALITDGYADFIAAMLAERQSTHLPPFSFLALLRAEAQNQLLATQFLQQVREVVSPKLSHHLTLLGPAPAPMARRAGYHRAQLLIRSSKRQAMQDFLPDLVKQINDNKMAKKIRWSLDVDPLEMF